MAEARLYTIYKNEIVPKLQEEFGYTNVNAVPKLQKIVINVGASEAVNDSKYLDTVIENIGLIQVKKQSKPKQKNQSLTLNFVKACRSVARLHCARKSCMNFLTD